MAVYNPKVDKEYMDVFRRADSAMYVDKKKKKAMEGQGQLWYLQMKNVQDVTNVFVHVQR